LILKHASFVQIPAGFEFYENPRDAKVVLRKIPRYNIADAEVEIVESVMKKLDAVEHYIVEKGADHITIFTGNSTNMDFSEHPEWRTYYILHQNYDDVMRFEKVRKTWHAQRFCYRSRVDDWITIGHGKDLRELAETFCPHIERDSFYELY